MGRHLHATSHLLTLVAKDSVPLVTSSVSTWSLLSRATFSLIVKSDRKRGEEEAHSVI